MRNALIPPATALAAFVVALAAAQGPPLTTAGNGEPIPMPGATYAAQVGGRSVKVPVGMVVVPAGSFTMGSGGPRGERGGPGGRPPGGGRDGGGGMRGERRGPPPGGGGPGGAMGGGAAAHAVTLPTYAIGKFDVTNAEYKAFLDATGGRAPRYWRGGTYPAGRANHPVAFVSLVEARAYAAWVAKATGVDVVIPTAEQWEKAARGPANTYYPWGDSFDASVQDGVLVARCNFNALVSLDALAHHGKETTTYAERGSTLLGQATTLDGVVAIDAQGRRSAFAVEPNGYVEGWIEHSTGTGFTATAYFHAISDGGGYTTPVGAYESGKSGYGVYDAVGNLWNRTESTTVAANGVERGTSVNEIRGGGWYSPARSCVTVSDHEGRQARGAYNTVGFRIAANLG